MRSKEERIAEVKRRAAEKERKERQRRGRLTAAFSAAACLVLIVGVSLCLPGITGQMEPGGTAGLETVGGIFGGSEALGYIVIGLLAFLLGVSVTILCFRIRRMDGQERAEEENGDEHGAD